MCAGIFPNSIVNHTMVCLSLDGNSDKVRENIGHSSGDRDLEPKTKRNSRNTHTHYKMNPDIALTVQGIQSWTTGYDTRSSYNLAWATFGGDTDEQFCQCYCTSGAFFHFWSSVPMSTKLNVLHMCCLDLLKTIVTSAFKCCLHMITFIEKGLLPQLQFQENLFFFFFFGATLRTTEGKWNISVWVTTPTKIPKVKCSKVKPSQYHTVC